MFRDSDIYAKSKEEVIELLQQYDHALELEKRYHAILDHMMEGFQIIDFDWTYLYVNQTVIRQSRKDADELTGRTMMDVYPGIETTELFSVLHQCMQNRVATQFQNQFFYPDGSYGWFDLSIQPVHDGLFILSMEITERKAAEESLQRLNDILEQKVMLRTAQLAAKNKEIIDSIRYACKIQKAFLPDKSKLQRAFPASFILFKPKDLVSGDFYWLQNVNGKVVLAVADCTGHGVPGALISIIGAHVLTDVAHLHSEPSAMLRELNKRIKSALRQTDNEASSHDGMDIALCSFDPEKRVLEYTGANRPFWLIRKDAQTVEEVRATRHAIGGLTADEQEFHLHTLELEEGDTFYISSDGYADQDGGEKGKKLLKRNFLQLLLNIQHLPMEQQKNYLDAFIDEWRGSRPQLDDILVIGIRL